jgi:uncharacterized protein (DUF427 family)
MESGFLSMAKEKESIQGTESVWDYPRPPRIEKVSKHIQVFFGGKPIADTKAAFIVLETSHPPTYYIPPEDISLEFLQKTNKRTICEYKGVAEYHDLKVDDRVSKNAAWSYPNPTPAYEPLKDYISFYPSRVDGCYVDGERVRAQEGDFYGGWITDNIIGPFKGALGTEGW